MSVLIATGVLAAYIPLVEVLPGWHERGIGTELMNVLLDQLKHGPETRQVEPSCPLKNAYAATLIPAAFSCRPQEISSFSSHEPTASPQLKTNYLQPESTKSNLLRSQCLTLILLSPLMQTKPCAFNTDITATPFSF